MLLYSSSVYTVLPVPVPYTVNVKLTVDAEAGSSLKGSATHRVQLQLFHETRSMYKLSITTNTKWSRTQPRRAAIRNQQRES